MNFDCPLINFGSVEKYLHTTSLDHGTKYVDIN